MKIFAKSEEKYLKTVIVYVDSDDALYYDSEFKEEVKEDDLFNLFLKGVVACADDTYYKAVSYNADTGIDFGIAD